MNGKIIVVTHKDYDMPKDEIYMPICVGNGRETLKNKFQVDNVGDNISEKNPTYCELTAIYWAWKNLNLEELEYIGVSHYRRHFSMRTRETQVRYAIMGDEVDKLIEIYGKDVVFTTPCRRYFNSISKHYITSKKGYKKTHETDIEYLIDAVRICCPEYGDDLEYVLNGKKAHMFNMFIMSSSNYEKYCRWLFQIIDKVVEFNEERIEQKRYAGALSEFLLDVWLRHNGYNYIELNLLESERVGFIRKTCNALARMLGIK